MSHTPIQTLYLQWFFKKITVIGTIMLFYIQGCQGTVQWSNLSKTAHLVKWSSHDLKTGSMNPEHCSQPYTNLSNSGR